MTHYVKTTTRDHPRFGAMNQCTYLGTDLPDEVTHSTDKYDVYIDAFDSKDDFQTFGNID